jgi:signal transduction histidine kinase
MSISALCNDIFAQFLVFSPNVSLLVYYSHFSVIILSLFLGVFVIYKNPKDLLSKALFSMFMSFALWVFLDSVFWASNKANVIMFVWSLQILVEPLIYLSALYLIYTLAYKKDFSLGSKIVAFVLYAPIFLFSATSYSLSGFDTVSCLSIEGPLGYYAYILEGIYVVWLLFIVFKKYRESKERLFKQQLFYITLGTFLFLFAFSWSNLISSLTENWKISQIGLFFMPVLIGFLVYSIVKFKTFNIKIIATQALVATLTVLIAAQFIFIKSPVNIVLNSVTLLAVIIFGTFLVKSVSREISQKEQLQTLSLKLEDANEKLQSLDKLKTEFLSLASHQLRSPLTAIKGYTSMLLEGSFGDVNDSQKEAIDRVFQSSQHLTKVVEDLLNVTKIEQGGMQYVFEPTDIEIITNELVRELAVTASKKGLKLSFVRDNTRPYMVNADAEKIRQVILNFIDNAIKYTEAGSITVSMNHAGKEVAIAISDTGAGISPETKAKLFGKFNRGEAGTMNTGGSGLGLYLAKEIIKAHNGRVEVDSPGVGKGSTFTVYLAVSN